MPNLFSEGRIQPISVWSGEVVTLGKAVIVMDDKNKNANQLNIEVPEEIANGVYSNFVIVGHNSSEFVVDFVQILPGLPQAKVRSRVILAPQHAKRLLAALEDNLQKYEATFGRIQTFDGPQNTHPGFPGGPAGYA